ncbi:MAG: threonine synthase [Mariprofundaceae bacterium]|nr:threonine synthase [Mariprofundaceae bacterium]
MNKQIICITHGLVPSQDGLTLHPDLFLWEQHLLKRKRRWFATPPHNPLSLYAALLDTQPANLLASNIALDTSIQQYWIASPYHAQLTRDAVRVMAEELFPWCEEDAVWVCELLNPLLSEEGMKLKSVGAALLLVCENPLHATPVNFPEIAGSFLPNKHPVGVDGGHIMRLMSEIQMMLNQSPAEHRRIRGDMDVHGLWFWGGSEAHQKCPFEPINMASKNSFLQSMIEPRNAKIIITEPENLMHLVRQDSDLPKHVFLIGEGVMVHLNKPLLFRFRQRGWEVQGMASEKEGLQLIHQYC